MCEGMAYVAIDGDGRMVAATVDNPIDMVRIVDTAKDIVEWVNEGLNIKRVSVEDVRKYLGKNYE